MSEPTPLVRPGVRDVLDRIPPWYEQWGTALVALLLVAGVVLAGLIRYPEVQLAAVVVTPTPAPRLVVCPRAGTLQLVLPEGARVATGAVLATVQPTDTLPPTSQLPLLRAPCAGQLAYLAVNSPVRAGQAVLAVVPAARAVEAQAQVPLAGAGRVRPGQRVVLYLDAYPAEQFGTVAGTVATVAPLPVRGSYRLLVRLPQGLQTNTGQQLPATAALSGTARILLQDASLLERLVRPVRQLLRGRF